MKEASKLEGLAASWYKKAPHLPKNGQKWLADNVWWLALIGVVLGAFAAYGVLSLVFWAGTALVAFGGAFGAVLGGLAVVATIVSLAVWIVSIVLMAMAISPLKAHLRRGWTLLFWVTLVNVLGVAIEFLFSFNFFGLIWGLLAAAVGAYFLFEIREFFEAKPVKAAEPALKKTAR